LIITPTFSAYGVVIYEMVTGQQPFAGRNRIEILHAVINDRPCPISDLVVNPPAELQSLLDRAMAKRPKDRFPTMAAMRDELKVLMRQVTGEAGLPTEAAGNSGGTTAGTNHLAALQQDRSDAWRRSFRALSPRGRG
jgi:serine/threonine-protein kinase